MVRSNTITKDHELENSIVQSLLEAVQEAQTEAREAKARAARLEEKLGKLETMVRQE